MKRKFLLIILFISIILGSIFIYDKNKKMSNISEDMEYSNDWDVREFINKVKVLYKSSDRKNVIKALGPLA